MLVALMIQPRTWTLLRAAVDVLLEATLKAMDLDDVRRHILETDDVVDAHHCTFRLEPAGHVAHERGGH